MRVDDDELLHLESLRPRLTDQARLSILRITDACWDGPGYSSCEVYCAVLDHGVHNPEQYQAFREARGD
jgi:hypothetical protein